MVGCGAHRCGLGAGAAGEYRGPGGHGHGAGWRVAVGWCGHVDVSAGRCQWLCVSVAGFDGSFGVEFGCGYGQCDGELCRGGGGVRKVSACEGDGDQYGWLDGCVLGGDGCGVAGCAGQQRGAGGDGHGSGW